MPQQPQGSPDDTLVALVAISNPQQVTSPRLVWFPQEPCEASSLGPSPLGHSLPQPLHGHWPDPSSLGMWSEMERTHEGLYLHPQKDGTDNKADLTVAQRLSAPGLLSRQVGIPK